MRFKHYGDSLQSGKLGLQDLTASDFTAAGGLDLGLSARLSSERLMMSMSAMRLNPFLFATVAGRVTRRTIIAAKSLLTRQLWRVSKMPYTREFYSVNEASKPAEKRVHHNNSLCPAGRDIPQHERRYGSPYRLCKDCAELNRLGR